MSKRTNRARAVLAAAAGLAAMAAAPTHAAPGGQSSPQSFKLAPETLVVDAATVKRDLAGVSADAHTYRFRALTGPLARVHVGSVLILNHATMDRVTRVVHKGPGATVTTVPATIGEAFTSANLHFSGAPRWGDVIVQRVGGLPKVAADRLTRPPGYLTGVTAHAADGISKSITIAGNVGKFGYNLHFEPAPDRLNFSGTLCFQAGSICNNGLAKAGLAMMGNISGYIQATDADAKLELAFSHPLDMAMSLFGLKIHYSITWGVGRGTGGEGQPDPPAFHIPVGVNVPFTVPGPVPLPMFIRVQFGMDVKLGVTSHNASLSGTINDDTDVASEQLEANGPKIDGHADQATMEAAITPRQSLSLAAVGIGLGFQIPKIGIGLGITDVNGFGYVENVVGIGQSDGSAIGGQLCSDYDVYLDLKEGIDLQFLGENYNKSRLLIPEKHKRLHQC